MSETVYIAGGARTPMGGLQGCFADLTAVNLGAAAIEEAISRANLSGDDVQEVIMGCVLPNGLRQGPARQAAMDAGIPVESGATTINKLCGSGMKATMLAHDLIKAGTNDIMVSGGMESMTNAPYMLPKARGGMRMGHGEVQDSMFTDGLEDAKTGRLMGSFAQEIADRYQLTREDMDAFAIGSLTKAQKAIEDGSLKAETVPVTVKSRKGEVIVEDDEQPGNANLDKIPTLRPAFKEDGTVTAANSSSISDGASALVLASESAVEERGLKPVAKIVGHTTNSLHPSEFTIAPIGAIEKLLEKTGWDKDDVDLFEINEAFAMVTMLATRELGLDPEKVNIHGGACAQGHPVGSTGSRIIVSLMYALQKLGKKRGIAALCIGGGEATAVAIELV
ncbi:MAG: acetyl-CoA C-acyltransferase [Pseudomonadales bacterium]|nr:acetyl-CoA C-acyltransferase [Pseudomonadales bacterium]MBO6565863.1 acetyl-CoA C-acyltransferase [Pseudomonadales bacterium]MBO6596462.1 acetyl-CoA C-acyltransferase [Pseudomonadales bacterium]MBO6657668.1 acetyl-CoA C-acyltransferase [Pseudomonadales bacterium]MBO6704352.1 acetyl-CoA C-acyltransferase [Pseudomonadales bacterium]